MKTITNATKLLAFALFTTASIQAQSITVEQLIDEVDYDNLEYILKEFTGEKETKVGGKTVTIKNRDQANNDLAKDYILEKLESFGGDLEIEVQEFNTAGKNVIATQVGKENPDDIYIISAHYDSVTEYCADDNATGTAAVLEIAKTLSQVCLDNTIKYIFWDEEEIRLLGSDHYAKNLSSSMKSKIKGVINMDMLGFDYNKDRNIPVHTKDVAKSNQLKDDVVAIIEKYKSSINLTPEVPDEPVEGSDHASFWKQNMTAIMITDGLSYGTITPHYHKPTDRVSTLDLKYFQDMTKALMAIYATKGSISKDQTPCSFSVDKSKLQGVHVYPNPISNVVNISLKTINTPTTIKLMTVTGQHILSKAVTKLETQLNTENLASGVYFVEVTSGDKSSLTKVIKE